MINVVTRLAILTLAFGFTAHALAQDWESLDTGTSADLHAVHFLTVDVGFVAGAGGIVLMTTDGGLTWEDISPATGVDLHGVHVFDAETVIVVGDAGQIWRTADGGDNWESVSSGYDEGIFSVSFSGEVGIAGAQGMTILRSVDSGESWTIVTGGPGSLGFPYFGAHMFSQMHGFVAGQNAVFQPIVGYSQNGGAQWDYSTFYFQNNEGHLRDIHFLDAQTGIAVGASWNADGAIARSVDGGQSWNAVLHAQPLHAVASASSNTVFAAGAGGTVLKSEDGGLNWASEETPTNQDLNGLVFPADSTGYAVGEGGTALKWTPVPPVGTEGGADVAALTLEQNHPNPFTGQTVIRYHLPEPANVIIRIYDVLGREVMVLYDGHRAAGGHTTTLEASEVGAGVYYYVLEAGARRVAKTMMVVR